MSYGRYSKGAVWHIIGPHGTPLCVVFPGRVFIEITPELNVETLEGRTVCKRCGILKWPETARVTKEEVMLKLGQKKTWKYAAHEALVQHVRGIIYGDQVSDDQLRAALKMAMENFDEWLSSAVNNLESVYTKGGR